MIPISPIVRSNEELLRSVQCAARLALNGAGPIGLPSIHPPYHVLLLGLSRTISVLVI